jgi:hypothetical protein
MAGMRGPAYLSAIIMTPKKKSPASRRDLPALAYFVSELATALALLIGLLALTVRVGLLPVRILLLLSGFLAAALLAGLLTRVLVLLPRVLVLVGHRDLPSVNVTSWLNATAENNSQVRIWFQGKPGFAGIIAWRWLVATVADGTRNQTSSVQAL